MFITFESRKHISRVQFLALSAQISAVKNFKKKKFSIYAKILQFTHNFNYKRLENKILYLYNSILILNSTHNLC